MKTPFRFISCLLILLTAPLGAGEIKFVDSYLHSYFRDLEVKDDYLFAISPGWLIAFDVADKKSPVPVGKCRLKGTAKHIAISGDYAYILRCDSGMAIVNIANPKSPVVELYYEVAPRIIGVYAS